MSHDHPAPPVLRSSYWRRLALCAPLAACEEKKIRGLPLRVGRPHRGGSARRHNGGRPHRRGPALQPQSTTASCGAGGPTPKTTTTSSRTATSPPTASRGPRSPRASIPRPTVSFAPRSRAASCRPRTPSASRNASTTSPTTTRSRQATHPSSLTLEIGPVPVERQAPPARPHRRARPSSSTRERDAAAQPRLPHRHVRLDGRAEPPAAGQAVARTARRQLTAEGRVSIVTYAGDAGAAADADARRPEGPIRDAVDGAVGRRLAPTAAGGIQLAYAQAARRRFIDGGVNRVILGTDGDFNVGLTSESDLVRLIEKKRKTRRVSSPCWASAWATSRTRSWRSSRTTATATTPTSTTIDEARKVFVEQGGALVTVAKDVKLQVEFNPAQVDAYRLHRLREPPAQERGLQERREGRRRHGQRAHGHGPVRDRAGRGEGRPAGRGGRLKYQSKPGGHGGGPERRVADGADALQGPGGRRGKEMAFALAGNGLRKSGSTDFRFAAAVAEFGLVLRDSEYKGSAKWADVKEWAADAVGPDRKGYRRRLPGVARRSRAADEAGRLSSAPEPTAVRPWALNHRLSVDIGVRCSSLFWAAARLRVAAGAGGEDLGGPPGRRSATARGPAEPGRAQH